MENYPHISFQKDWQISPKSWNRLGQCEAIVRAISETPIQPDYRKKLLEVSMIKGAQATTAIEGNTLTESEIIKINQGEKLPLSKEYQEIEVKNILTALNELHKEIIFDKNESVISPELIKRFHKRIGTGLGESFPAIPGQFRNSNVVVGAVYRAPESQYVEEMIKKFCEFLKANFNYNSGEQNFTDSVIEAIVAHIYIAWIHPFNDGNGRTARLLEFYILLRGGLPDIASHILSNFYNETRSEYYRQLDKATKNKNLSTFIEYAVVGFRDGLNKTLKTIQENHFIIVWRNYIFERMKEVNYGQRAVFKRRRELMLKFPTGKWLSPEEILNSDTELLKIYYKKNPITLLRDLEELVKLDLLLKNDDSKKYKANTDILLFYIPLKK